MWYVSIWNLPGLARLKEDIHNLPANHKSVSNPLCRQCITFMNEADITYMVIRVNSHGPTGQEKGKEGKWRHARQEKTHVHSQVVRKGCGCIYKHFFN